MHDKESLNPFTIDWEWKSTLKDGVRIWLQARSQVVWCMVSRCMVTVYDWSKHAANNCKVTHHQPNTLHLHIAQTKNLIQHIEHKNSSLQTNIQQYLPTKSFLLLKCCYVPYARRLLINQYSCHVILWCVYRMFGTANKCFCTDVLSFLFSITSTDARDHQTSITDDTKVAARCTGEMHDMQTRWGIHWKSCQQVTTGSNYEFIQTCIKISISYCCSHQT